MPTTRPTLEAISPFFIVSNVDRTIAFYRDTLGFEVRFQQPEQDSLLRHPRPRRRATPGQVRQRRNAPLPNPARHPDMRWDAFVYTPDPDALAREFAEHGAAFSAPLTDTHDGLRGFEIRDPDGYVLFFGRPR